MSENMINEMYLLAIKSKLNRGVISVEDKLNCIIEELDLLRKHVPIISTPQQLNNFVSHNATTHEEQTQITECNEQKKGIAVSVIEVKYGNMPDEEGFDNRDLNSLQDNLYYRLEINTNTTEAEFNLMTENRVAEDYKQSPGIAPSYAVKFENQPSEGAKLQVVEKGLLKKVKRYWEIVKPCRMKWS